MMKILKHRNLMTIVYCLCSLLPILAIGVRSAYVICNKNAYQSYYGETINEKQKVDLDNDSQLNQNTTYYTSPFGITLASNELNANYYLTNLEVAYQGNVSASSIETINIHKEDIYRIYFTETSNNDFRMTLYELVNNTATYVIAFNNTQNIIFSFNLISVDNNNVKHYLYYYEYNKYSYLDNVFEYSVSRFVDENNFGQLDFFNWFTDMFLSDNAVNNLYVHFANWYMNYVMLISLMHIFFLVLMWFVQYVRRLLERGLNYDW